MLKTGVGLWKCVFGSQDFAPGQGERDSFIWPKMLYAENHSPKKELEVNHYTEPKILLLLHGNEWEPRTGLFIID